VFIGHSLDVGSFTQAERAYFAQIYGAPQLHAAFEVYRAFPKDAAFNVAQTARNATPLVVAVGEKSSFAPLLPKFVAGYHAKGMTRVESARIPGASHYVVADNPEAVADLVERYAGNAR
jgi:pimeloyl-ACP methyl ester carboxylesterase